MKNKGFTLIEVMIVVVIVGILAAIAYPSYQESIRKGNRAQARAALLSASAYLEKTTVATGVYATTLPASMQTVESNTYDISLAGASGTAYTLNAKPTGVQATDKCGTFSLTNTGVKSQTGTAAASECWP